MPWNECKPMDERLRFIARLLEGEKMAPLCREFGISRVTGYKIFNQPFKCTVRRNHFRSVFNIWLAPFAIIATDGPGYVESFISRFGLEIQHDEIWIIKIS